MNCFWIRFHRLLLLDLLCISFGAFLASKCITGEIRASFNRKIRTYTIVIVVTFRLIRHTLGNLKLICGTSRSTFLLLQSKELHVVLIYLHSYFIFLCFFVGFCGARRMNLFDTWLVFHHSGRQNNLFIKNLLRNLVTFLRKW